jgi:hypothetical protein
MDYPAVFVSTLFHSGTNAHFMHLQTDSYAKHKALQKYYEGIIDLVDTWAETYQGAYIHNPNFDRCRYWQGLSRLGL